MYDMVYFADTLRITYMEDGVIEVKPQSLDRAYKWCSKIRIIGLRLEGGWPSVRIASELINTLSLNLFNVALSLM
jgi:hypothetical protein